MVLAAIANIIYEFYCFLHGIITFACYVGYLLYYIIYKAVWIVQNVAVFTQIVYEDNHHFIQDTKAVIVGTSDFFIANIGKVCSGVSFVGTALLDGTVAVVSLLKLIVWYAAQSLQLIGDAVWMLITAPYQGFVLFDWLRDWISNQFRLFLNDGLEQITRYISQHMQLHSACGLVLLLLIWLNPRPIQLLRVFFTEKVHTVIVYLSEVFRPLLLHVNIYLTERLGRVESVQAENPNRSTVGICIICQENERTVAFIPCGHLCVCKVCARSLIHYNPRCPLCRSFINQKLEVYI